MTQEKRFQGEMDPELAALLGTVSAVNPEEEVHDFAHLFNDEEELEELDQDSVDSDDANGALHEVDINAERYPEITKSLEEVPHSAFENPEYYKTALAGEGDISHRVHGILQKSLKCTDVKDKGVFRQQLIPAYWDFLLNVARKATGKMPDPKKYLLRFSMIHPNFLKPEVLDIFSRVIEENNLNQPVYYLDEWFKAVGTSQVKMSTTDEVQIAKNNQTMKVKQLFEKARGKLDGSKALLKSKDAEKLALEKLVIDRFSHVTEHTPLSEVQGVNCCYTDNQKRTINDVLDILKSLLKADREQDTLLRDFLQASEDVRTLQAKVEEGGPEEIDLKAVDTEFASVRQMVKMTIGRQGNHFPLLTSDYFHSRAENVGTRENIISLLARIESIDPEAYCRIYKNRVNRISPFVIIVPTYGDYGFCWEPFDRHNRATSRGRIIVPMYPRSLYLAILTAVGDLRWQVAKEKASFYWMEEGITGHYYQWFQKNKMKGDLKDSFIRSYIDWITKESEGTQKLDKDLRGTFWRYLPFAQPIKEKLKTRNFVYQELYQRDVNRSMSDGY
jgi:hypothetical protein